MYSGYFLIVIGCLEKLLLVISAFPLLLPVLIYRKFKHKKNDWLVDFIFE
jgi:hypothetical protein